MLDPPLCRIVNGLLSFWLTSFIQRKRMGNELDEIRENFLGTRVHFIFVLIGCFR